MVLWFYRGNRMRDKAIKPWSDNDKQKTKVFNKYTMGR